ncbi:hypothetical protein BC835DRAFT_929261 [Cytidiella melzeri]|nr:hypothetical protein BC835DRAFT_929261 [Cytidiella melzeri]
MINSSCLRNHISQSTALQSCLQRIPTTSRLAHRIPGLLNAYKALYTADVEESRNRHVASSSCVGEKVTDESHITPFSSIMLLTHHSGIYSSEVSMNVCGVPFYSSPSTRHHPASPLPDTPFIPPHTPLPLIHPSSLFLWQKHTLYNVSLANPLSTLV